MGPPLILPRSLGLVGTLLYGRRRRVEVVVITGGGGLPAQKGPFACQVSQRLDANLPTLELS